MTIAYVKGDLLASGADVLVIPVNCRGVAGKGLALSARQQYDGWYERYVTACELRHILVGQPYLHRVGNQVFLDFPTKDAVYADSKLCWIEQGLDFLWKHTGPWHEDQWTCAFPKLGCGAGGLLWKEVKPLMEQYLTPLKATCLIFE